MNLKNKPNEYAEALGRTLDEAPKAVIAAVAVSLLSTGGERLSQAESLFRLEWWVLFRAGIVPQRPPGPELTSENFVLPAPR